jgi:hypothetical protein
MSFENIQLPPFLLADLFKNSLVEFDREITGPKLTTPKAPKKKAD